MPGLNLYTSNRMEILAEKLAGILDSPLTSPLQQEIIVVQSKGMERWLSMELARRHGICANVRFPFPNHFVHTVFREVLPDLPESAPFDPAVMAWEIMSLLPACLERPGFESLRGYLGDAEAGLKLFQLSGRIADLFDQYLLFRPDMILRWEKGTDDHWQAVLWRELVKGKEKTHRAALQKAFFEAIQTPGAALKGLPERIAIFGISALPPFHLQVLTAVAGFTDVNLFLMNPCREYWGDIVSDREITRAAAKRKEPGLTPDALHLEKGNSLLASMGALGREFFDLISGLDGRETELFADPGEETLLMALQSDILNLRERGRDGRKTAIRGNDGSVRIHSCHSPMREIEVLQDSLLALFESNPGLEPADVLVMTPDVALYAPFIQAVFSLPKDDPRWIPFSIADRGLRQESPVVNAFFNLLDLAGSRFGASRVFDILEAPAVRARFSLTEEDLELIHHWIRETRIRWGIDAESRAALDLPATPWNTWQAGIDRMLLGYALPAHADEALFLGILPYDRIEGSDTAVLGNFLAFTERLFKAMAQLGEARTLQEWAVFLSPFLDVFFAAEEDPLEEIQAIRRTLHELAGLQDLSGFSGKVGLDVMKAFLRENLEKKGFGFGFLTGGITFCAMLPMRSIPFRVICLVGMGDETYPRQHRPLGFDLMAKRPRPGDRSRRKDDRYLFLEALLSARETLYISYVGQSIKDNSLRPPSVLVSELMDAIEENFEFPNGGPIREEIVTVHPLQAFSPACFRKDGPLFSYSVENCRAARQAAGERRPPADFIPSGLPGPGDEWRTVDIEALCAFFAHPARFLLTRRLRIYLEEEPAILDESEPFSVEGLEKYGIRQEIAARALEGGSPKDLYPAILASGKLPHGTPGACQYEALWRSTEEFLGKVRPYTVGGSLEPLAVDLAVAGFRLTGTIGGLYPQGLVHYRLAKVRLRDRLRAWIHRLILHRALGSDAPRQTILICEDLLGRYPAPDNGERHLEVLLDLYWRGLMKPLHFFPRSSWAYAEQMAKGDDDGKSLRAAEGHWDNYEWPESGDPYFALCFRAEDPLEHEEFRELALAICGPIQKAEGKIK